MSCHGMIGGGCYVEIWRLGTNGGAAVSAVESAEAESVLESGVEGSAALVNVGDPESVYRHDRQTRHAVESERDGRGVKAAVGRAETWAGSCA